MDFGALPPEINSARMYAGAGAAPMLTAAAAWNSTAVELSTAASSIESVITRLSTEQWIGPASMSMVAATQPLLAWLTYTAESSTLAAAQAMASAAAFEMAYAVTVPPAEVAANRAMLSALTATNIFGQNVPAIAATEARYGEMWAQDASAMYGYAAAAATAGRLNPLNSPSAVTNQSGIANQAAAVGQAAASASAQQVSLVEQINNIPEAVLGLASPLHSSGIQEVLDELLKLWMTDVPLSVESAFHGFAAVADVALTTIPTLYFLLITTDGASALGAADPGFAAAAALSTTVTEASVGATPVLAGLGDAATVGPLSVPASWSTAAPAVSTGTALEGTGWSVPHEDGPGATMLTAPGGIATANSAGPGAGPRYGIKPTVMPKSVIG